MIDGRIFTNQQKSTLKIPSLENYINSNLNYDIRNIDLSLSEEMAHISFLHTQATYQYLKENNYIILESAFNDFFKQVKDFFIKLKQTILDFVKKAISYFQSYTNNFDKFLIAHKTELNNFDDEIEFEHGYEYTFSDQIPNIKVINDAISDFNNNITNSNNLTMEMINDKRMKFIDENSKNELRSKILKIKKPIIIDDFIIETKKTFRNGANEPLSINVDKKYIENMISNYSKIKANMKIIIKERDNIIKSLDNIIYLFKNKINITTDNKIQLNRLIFNTKDVKTDSIYLNNEGDLASILNNYYQFEFIRFNFIYNCVYVTFFEKINAMKECLKQYETITQQVLTLVNEKNINNDMGDVI